MSEMSDFSNKNVHFFAPYLHIFALISRVDFSQPKYVGRLKSTLLAKIISSFKSNFSRLMPKNLNQTESQLHRREKGIWQRKYYDHIIRDEMDFNKHLDYIHYNSIKHLNISPKDWEFSSFKKFVKQGFYQEDWCNLDDKNDVLNMDLE